MIQREIAIYASVYSDRLEKVENTLKKVFKSENFKKIEQGGSQFGASMRGRASGQKLLVPN